LKEYLNENIYHAQNISTVAESTAINIKVTVAPVSCDQKLAGLNKPDVRENPLAVIKVLRLLVNFNVSLNIFIAAPCKKKVQIQGDDRFPVLIIFQLL
jgi:hypothetical protein